MPTAAKATPAQKATAALAKKSTPAKAAARAATQPAPVKPAAAAVNKGPATRVTPLPPQESAGQNNASSPWEPSRPCQGWPSGRHARVSGAKGRAGVRPSAPTAATAGPAHTAVRTVHGTDLTQQAGKVG